MPPSPGGLLPARVGEFDVAAGLGLLGMTFGQLRADGDDLGSAPASLNGALANRTRPLEDILTPIRHSRHMLPPQIPPPPERTGALDRNHATTH